VRGLNDAGVGVELPDERDHPVSILVAHQVTFVDEDDIGKLHLLHQQGRDVAVVALLRLPLAVQQVVHGIEIAEEVVSVHHSDHGVESSDTPQGQTLGIKRKRLGHRQRLAHPRRLDHKVIEVTAAGKLSDLQQQVLAKRAADAPVLRPSASRAATQTREADSPASPLGVLSIQQRSQQSWRPH
jgi:hypothetical protein